VIANAVDAATAQPTATGPRPTIAASLPLPLPLLRDAPGRLVAPLFPG
jgi:hypothetical protein